MYNLDVYDTYQDLAAENIIQVDDLKKIEDNHITYTLQVDSHSNGDVTQINMTNGDI